MSDSESDIHGQQVDVIEPDPQSRTVPYTLAHCIEKFQEIHLVSFSNEINAMHQEAMQPQLYHCYTMKCTQNF